MGLIGWIVDRVFAVFDRPRPPELRDARRFERDGVSFEYPRNWKIDEEDVGDACLSVHLETAMGSVCCITVMVPNTGMDLAGYAESAVEGFHKGISEAFRLGSIQPFRTDGWALDPTTQRIAGKDRRGVRLDVEARGFGEPILSRFEIYHVDEPDYGAFLLTNSVEVSRWEVELPGYEMLWRSLAVVAAGRVR